MIMHRIDLALLLIFTNIACINACSQKPSGEGKALYAKHCLVCHQADGSGVPGMFPALNRTKKISEPADELIKIILSGSQKTAETEGEIYAQVMPAMNYLTDTEIADLLTYIRSNFGNKAKPVTAREVSRMREKGKGAVKK